MRYADFDIFLFLVLAILFVLLIKKLISITLKLFNITFTTSQFLWNWSSVFLGVLGCLIIILDAYFDIDIRKPILNSIDKIISYPRPFFCKFTKFCPELEFKNALKLNNTFAKMDALKTLKLKFQDKKNTQGFSVFFNNLENAIFLVQNDITTINERTPLEQKKFELRSKIVSQEKMNREKIQSLIALQVDLIAFEDALMKNTEQAYYNYINDKSLTIYDSFALYLIEKISEKNKIQKKVKLENELFLTSKSLNSIDQLKQYIDTCEYCFHINEAKNHIAQLKKITVTKKQQASEPKKKRNVIRKSKTKKPAENTKNHTYSADNKLGQCLKRNKNDLSKCKLSTN